MQQSHLLSDVRSVGPIIWRMKKYYKESRKKGTSYTQSNEGRLLDWSHLA